MSLIYFFLGFYLMIGVFIAILYIKMNVDKSFKHLFFNFFYIMIAWLPASIKGKPATKEEINKIQTKMMMDKMIARAKKGESDLK